MQILRFFEISAHSHCVRHRYTAINGSKTTRLMATADCAKNECIDFAKCIICDLAKLPI